MNIEHIEVLVEETSMERTLRALLPRLLGLVTFQIYTYQGKADLLKKLPARLKAYSSFLPPTWKIVVLVDRDDDDCQHLKETLETAARDASLTTLSSSLGSSRYSVINRIAIEELEAWYFGDWKAVRTAYPKLNPNIPSQALYRSSDRIVGGTWEAFERVGRKAGYFKTGLRKIEAAQKIAQHFDPDRNSSPSFRVFCSALSRLKHVS